MGSKMAQEVENEKMNEKRAGTSMTCGKELEALRPRKQFGAR